MESAMRQQRDTFAGYERNPSAEGRAVNRRIKLEELTIYDSNSLWILISSR